MAWAFVELWIFELLLFQQALVLVYNYSVLIIELIYHTVDTSLTGLLCNGSELECFKQVNTQKTSVGFYAKVMGRWWELGEIMIVTGEVLSVWKHLPWMLSHNLSKHFTLEHKGIFLTMQILPLSCYKRSIGSYSWD